MSGAVLVALAAAIGNLLQGWDNATIAGAVLYIKKEFNLQTQPTIEGLIVAMSLIGATVITTFSGPVSDMLGRRPMLIISSVLYFLSGLVMLWAPNVYVLLLARLLDGFGIGLAVTLVPVYISETAPPEIRGEMALLMEGMGAGGEVSIEEYIICPDSELADSQEHAEEKDRIKLYGAEEGLSWIAKPVTGQSTLGLVSRHGSMENQSTLMDPMVTLFGSVHEKLPEMGSMRSMLFSNFGSMFNVAENQVKNENWDEESQRDGDKHMSDASGAESDDNIRSPLLSRQGTGAEGPPTSLCMRQGSNFSTANGGEQTSMGIGGGWQLAYRKDEKKEGALKRIYLHQEAGAGSRRGSIVSLPGCDIPAEGEFIHAAALVSQSVLRTESILAQQSIEEAVEQSEPISKGPGWRALFEPGVKHALIVGVGIQVLQQFSGINGVLYYTPQILEQAGVGVLLSNLGIGSDSASFLISAVTTLLMLPSIGIAMRLMDIAGRRLLLLATLPILLVSLIVLVLGNVITMGAVAHAVISTISVVVYFCCFVTGFGPIPNILCSEIFPTSVRGLCIAICALTFWFGDIIVTYSLPVMLTSIGLAGIFGIYAIVCAFAWVFVFLKVPETKGMPLEVITEFFAVGAKQSAKE